MITSHGAAPRPNSLVLVKHTRLQSTCLASNYLKAISKQQMVGAWWANGMAPGGKGDSNHFSFHPPVMLCQTLLTPAWVPSPSPVITMIFSTSPLAGRAHRQVICQHWAPIPTWQPLAGSGVEDDAP